MSPPNGRDAAEAGPGSGAGKVDKRDFDANRPLLLRDSGSASASGSAMGSSPASLTDDEDGDGEDERGGRGRGFGLGGASVLSDVVDEIRERDRRKVRMNVVRVCSFIWGVMSWLVSLFLLSRLSETIQS